MQIIKTSASFSCKILYFIMISCLFISKLHDDFFFFFFKYAFEFHKNKKHSALE